VRLNDKTENKSRVGIVHLKARSLIVSVELN